MDFNLLEELCKIQATSGDESKLKDFIIDHVNQHSKKWRSVPKIIEGEGFQDNLILVFGQPKTAFYSHLDSVGFTCRYQNQLLTIGSPEAETGDKLIGNDGLGPIECAITIDSNGNSMHDFSRRIDPGTTLVYKPNFIKQEESITSPYLDNRLGVFALLQLANVLENGVLVFSTYEEHGGGSAAFLAQHLYHTYSITKSIIVDVTWVTEGIQFGHGPVVSLRDAYIPRKKFVSEITTLLDESSFIYQLEVEASGGSDGSEIQRSSLPVDWCFIGVPINNPHAPNEEANVFDIVRLVSLLETLSIKL